MGFLIICSGVVLLQLAKSSKDVPDAAVFKGDLDQIRTIAEQEEPEYEPRADTIRGGAGIVRAISKVRTKRQAEEGRRIYEERHMLPVTEAEEYEWDGLRRRKTVSTAHSRSGSLKRSKTVHPPLGMSHFPLAENYDGVSEADSEVHPGFFGRIGRKSHTTFGSQAKRRAGHSPVPLGTVTSPNKLDPELGQDVHTFGLPPSLHKPSPTSDQREDTSYQGAGGDMTPVPPTSPGHQHIHFAGDVHDSQRDRVSSRGSSLAPPRPPPHTVVSSGSGGAKRQFSFQNVFHRKRSDSGEERPTSRGALSFMSGHSGHGPPSGGGSYPGTSGNGATEEERLGLVHGDSNLVLPKYSELTEEPEHSEEEWQVTSTGGSGSGSRAGSSPQDLSGDLGRQRTRDQYSGLAGDDEDELYDEPLRSPLTRDLDPRAGGGSGSGRFI